MMDDNAMIKTGSLSFVMPRGTSGDAIRRLNAECDEYRRRGHTICAASFAIIGQFKGGYGDWLITITIEAED